LSRKSLSQQKEESFKPKLVGGAREEDPKAKKVEEEKSCKACRRQKRATFSITSRRDEDLKRLLNPMETRTCRGGSGREKGGPFFKKD